MEIAAQPVNFTSEEYEVVATVVGVQDKDKLLTGSLLEEGDILIGIRTEGVAATSYPFIKVMLDKRPELYHARIDEDKFFLDELMKANSAFVREIMALQEKGYLRKAFRIGHALDRGDWSDIPEGLGACIELASVPVMPLYQFLFEQDMIGENVFARHFHMGIGMVAAVSEQHYQKVMEIIGQFSECWRIGRIESAHGHKGKKVWYEGQISWKR